MSSVLIMLYETPVYQNPQRFALNNFHQVPASSALSFETNQHFVPLRWPQPTARPINSQPTDAPPAVQPDTPPHFVPRSWPQTYGRAINSWSETSSALHFETNQHFVPLRWPQSLTRPLNSQPTDAPPVAAADNPPHFVPRTWASIWKTDASLLWQAARDFAVGPPFATNTHYSPTMWPSAWRVDANAYRSPNIDFAFTPPPVQVAVYARYTAGASVGMLTVIPGEKPS
jgi:hypothetical protein